MDLSSFVQINAIRTPKFDEFTYLMGKCYCSSDKEQINAAAKALCWFTYRTNFPAIGGDGPTTDKGWGCMLRCGQMLMAEALKTVHLGRGWEWTEKSPEENYRRLIRMFQDKRTSLFSLQQIAQMGVSEGKRMCEWFGPNTIAQCLKKLAIYDDWSQIAVHVAMDNLLIASDVSTLAKTPWRDVTAPDDEKRQKLTSSNDEREQRPVLILVPLRLGLTTINRAYLPSLQAFFKLPQCCGIVGGRPNHAVFFIGFSGEELYYLDPHTAQTTVDLDKKKETSPSFEDVRPESPNFEVLRPEEANSSDEEPEVLATQADIEDLEIEEDNSNGSTSHKENTDVHNVKNDISDDVKDISDEFKDAYEDFKDVSSDYKDASDEVSDDKERQGLEKANGAEVVEDEVVDVNKKNCQDEVVVDVNNKDNEAGYGNNKGGEDVNKNEDKDDKEEINTDENKEDSHQNDVVMAENHLNYGEKEIKSVKTNVKDDDNELNVAKSSDKDAENELKSDGKGDKTKKGDLEDTKEDSEGFKGNQKANKQGLKGNREALGGKEAIEEDKRIDSQKATSKPVQNEQESKPESSSPKPIPDDFDDSTFHCNDLLYMHFDSLDPSLALGFICTCAEDFNEMIKSIKETVLPASNPPIFEVLDERPAGWPKFVPYQGTSDPIPVVDYEDFADPGFDSDDNFEVLSLDS
ncbi:unnamed protein product [Bursaphelenchus okinawaensis]|uniref:Cysteine protease n=1 Tax=Bursaphelenchus okinawaensis TaxID=465554 RepID=A0A811LI33_9BILA|nr:unnamed protein product [Bursaphelenchus okinawaensis]CAG9124195.1 unnamed protein product [Bursaphelenchus okinawaensis]